MCVRIKLTCPGAIIKSISLNELCEALSVIPGYDDPFGLRAIQTTHSTGVARQILRGRLEFSFQAGAAIGRLSAIFETPSELLDDFVQTISKDFRLQGSLSKWRQNKAFVDGVFFGRAEKRLSPTTPHTDCFGNFVKSVEDSLQSGKADINVDQEG